MKLFNVISIFCFAMLFTRVSFAQKATTGQMGTMQADEIEQVDKKKKASSGSSKAKRKAHNYAKSECEKELVKSFNLLDKIHAKGINKDLSQDEIKELNKSHAEQKAEIMQRCILAKMQEMGY